MTIAAHVSSVSSAIFSAVPQAGSRPLCRGSTIRQLKLFTGLDSAALAEIAKAARLQSIHRGCSVFKQGEAPVSIFLVLNGRFRTMQVAPAGDQVIMRFEGAGDLMGHLAALNSTTYPATPTAIVDSLVVVWTSRVFIDLMQHHAPFALAVARFMSKSVEEAHTRLQEAATERVERRIAHAVLRLIRQAGHPIEGGIEIPFPITRQDIASMTNATLCTVSRVLSAWEQRGFIDGGRQRLVLRDPHALVSIADDEQPGRTLLLSKTERSLATATSAQHQSVSGEAASSRASRSQSTLYSEATSRIV